VLAKEPAFRANIFRNLPASFPTTRCRENINGPDHSCSGVDQPDNERLVPLIEKELPTGIDHSQQRSNTHNLLASYNT